MDTTIFVPLSAVFGLVLFGLAVRWYYWPWARRVSLKEAATPILLLHMIRYEGLGFLVPGVVSPLLDPTFAHSSAYGDLTAACLALLALVALRFESAAARPLLWIFALEGFVDLLTAVGLGIKHAQGGLLQTMYFIPTIGVPLLLVTHVALFFLLLRKRGATQA